jgi:ABC transporter ATM
MFSLAPRGLAVARLGCVRAIRTQRPTFGLFRTSLPPSRPSKLITLRLVGHLARDKPTANPPQKVSENVKSKPEPPNGTVEHLTNAEQRRSDWNIIKQLFTNVWPENDWRTRGTVLLGFVLLFSAKVRTRFRDLSKSPVDFGPVAECPGPGVI